MDAALEVAVARQHRGDHEIAFIHSLGDRVGQRAGVADAGGAAVADQIEAERLEIVHEAGLAQVVGHHLGARGQRGLDVGRRLQAAGAGVAREQAGAEHHARIGGVGAAGDRGDDDVTVLSA